jgi:hypothetical protein
VTCALLGLVRHESAKLLMIASGRQVHQLPSAREIGKEVRKGDIFDQNAEQTLVEAMCEVELLQAPARTQPRAGDQKKNCLAAVRRLVEGALPTLAGDDAAFGVEIEENVVPAFGLEPVAQRDRFGVVRA